MYNHIRFGIVSLTMILTGCGNMPTPTAEIRSINLSTKQYEHLDCPALNSKLAQLNLVEQELSSAQDRRISSSAGHALFYGWGQGDGMETIELVKARGQIGSVQNERSKKKCGN